MAKKSTAISRIEVLNDCFECLHQVLQWGIRSSNFTNEYWYKADALIQLLEVHDCGSVGGYDRSNPVKDITPYKLYNRFLAVVAKYNDEPNIKPVCDFTLDDITYSFTKLTEFRMKKP
jgi:hypothetical protein